MPASAKILKIIFVILFLVTVGELGYYIFYTNSQFKNQTQNKNAPLYQNLNITNQPQGVVKIKTDKIDYSYINYLANYSEKESIKVFLTTEMIGKIKDLSFNVTHNNRLFLASFKQVDSTGKILNSYLIDENNHFFSINSLGEKKKVEYSKLKEGDLVKYVYKTDMSKNMTSDPNIQDEFIILNEK